MHQPPRLQNRVPRSVKQKDFVKWRFHRNRSKFMEKRVTEFSRMTERWVLAHAGNRFDDRRLKSPGDLFARFTEVPREIMANIRCEEFRLANGETHFVARRSRMTSSQTFFKFSGEYGVNFPRAALR